jgi:hypothetical protein
MGVLKFWTELSNLGARQPEKQGFIIGLARKAKVADLEF